MTRLSRGDRRTAPPGVAGVGVSFFLLAGLLALFFAGQPALAAGPSLTILSPANNAIIGNGSPVIVTFSISNFVLVQPGRVGQVANASEGHVNVTVDGQLVRLMTQVEPIVLQLDSGSHPIVLQLRNSNGSALTPDVSASITVVVTHGPAGGKPSISILFPASGSSSGHDVYVAVTIRNFTLVDPHGRPNAPNEGHLLVQVGGLYQQELARYEPAFVVDMPDGTNNITVFLVNNDNSQLSPVVSDTTTVHIKAATATLPEILNLGLTVVLIWILIVLVRRRRKASERLASRTETKPSEDETK